MENCGFAYTNSIINGKYKLPILYAIGQQGALRYNELFRCIGASHRTLSGSLKDLESDGMIVRTEFAQIPPRVEYSLTARAAELLPVLEQLCAWGEAHKND